MGTLEIRYSITMSDNHFIQELKLMGGGLKMYIQQTSHLILPAYMTWSQQTSCFS